MKPITEMSLAEFGAFVASHLLARGIEVVLTGGGCVAIYSQNRYTSFDLDFVGGRGAERRKIKSAMHELGFTEKDRYFSHPDTDFLVEFPSGPLAVGDEPVREVVEREFSTGKLRLLSATDCVKDRLAGYFHWRDLQCLEQAVLVASANMVDLDELARWSRHEGMIEEFNRIRDKLVS